LKTVDLQGRLSERDRRALIAVAGQFFVNGAMTASFLARAPQIRDRIDVSIEGFGLLLTAAAVFGLVGSALAGRIIHATGTKRVLQVGAVVMVLCLPVIGNATSPAVLLIGMLGYALLDVMVDISMNLQGSWISARRHTGVMNRLHGLWSLGTLAGGLGAALANAAGLSTAAHLTAVAAIMGIVLLFVTSNLLPHDQADHGDESMSGAGALARRPAKTPIVLLMVAGMFAVVSEVTGGDWASFRLTDDFGATAALGSIAFVAYTFGMTSMRLAGDSAQQRLGHVGLHRTSVAVAVFGFGLAALAPSEAASIAGFVLVGVGVATFMPKLYDDAARLPGRRGGAMGAMTGGMRIAYLVTPVAVGGLAGTGLTVGDAIAISTLPAVIGLAVATEANRRLLQTSAGI